MRRAAFVVATALVAAAACVPGTSCGWDDVLVADGTYRLTLGEVYSSSSTTARFSVAEALTGYPLPSCAGLDEIASGEQIDLHLVGGTRTADACSRWDIEIGSPAITSTGPFEITLNQHPTNLMRQGLTRDFGGGCVMGWEFTVHSPGNDPFATQVSSALPVVVAYRLGLAPRGAAATACATLLGVTPPAPSVDFRCGDMFVSTLEQL